MINVEAWCMIREFARQGLRLTDIAQRVGGDRKTVRKYRADPEPPRYTARPPRVSTLDPFQSSVQQRLECGVDNGAVLYRELCARGDDGKKTSLRVYVQPRRRAARHPACVRFETPPGQQGQVAWGHFGPIWPAGRPRRLSGLALTLGDSRALSAECTVSSGMMAFLRCPMHAFADLGGVPEHLLHDHQKPVVHTHDPGGAHLWNARSLDFAEHDGLVPRRCRPYRAQTKGQVDSGLKDIRRNCWPSGPDVPALDALNEALGGWLAEVAKVRSHGTTPEVPLVRLAQEPLRPVHVAPYDLAMGSTRWSSKDGLIRYGGNRYAVPAGSAVSQLTVCETPEGRLDISAGRECIARHALVAGPHQSLVDPAHVDALWQALKAQESPHPMPRAGPRVGPPVTEPPVDVRSLELYEAFVMGDA